MLVLLWQFYNTQLLAAEDFAEARDGHSALYFQSVPMVQLQSHSTAGHVVHTSSVQEVLASDPSRTSDERKNMQLKLYERTMIAGIFAGVSVVDQIIMLIGIAGCYSNSTSSGFYTPSQCQLARSLLFSLATGGSILPLLQLERITPTLVSDCNSCFLKVNRVIPIVLLGALGAFFSLMAYAGGVPSSSSDNNTSFVIWFSGSILSIHATVAAGVLAIRTAYLVRPTWDNSVGNLS